MSKELPEGYIPFPDELSDDMAEVICKHGRCCGGIAYDLYEELKQVVAKELASENELNEFPNPMEDDRD